MTVAYINHSGIHRIFFLQRSCLILHAGGDVTPALKKSRGGGGGGGEDFFFPTLKICVNFPGMGRGILTHHQSL